VNVDREVWFDFFGITSDLNAILTIRDMDEGTRQDLQNQVRKLEEWRVMNLAIAEPFEYTVEDCPHDYCTSTCTGCGYTSG